MYSRLTMLKERNAFPVTLYLSVCLLWIGQCADVQAQNVKNHTEEVKLAELGTTIKYDDVEKAGMKAEEIKTSVDKSLGEIESLVSNLEREAKAMDAHLEKLQQEKKGYEGAAATPTFIELLDKELSVMKEKIDIDNEQIETYEDRITALQNQSKVYADWVVLLKSIVKLEDLHSISYDQTATIRKEVDIAKSYITAVEAGIKEKESVISFFTNRLEEIKDKVSNSERDVAADLESLKEKVKDGELIKKVQEKIDSVFLWEKAINAQWITIFGTRLETAKTRYDQAQQELKNAKYHAAFLAEKANSLEERSRVEELKKKQAELEAAKKAEEMDQKIAEINRAEAEKALQEATKKGEEIALEQMTATSPEKTRVLELAAEVHKQMGSVAKKKDELITEGSQRYKDVTEYKELEANIELFLNKGSSSKEIDELRKKIDAEMEWFSEGKTVVESLITSLKQEEKLCSDNLAKASDEIAKIEKEVSSFEDKELARQAKEYARQKLEVQKELCGLITTRLERLHERLEIKKNALDLLNKTKEKLIKMKAANVWTRIESNVSPDTLRSMYKDLVNCYAQSNSFYTVIQADVKNYISRISDRKHITTFWVRVCGLIALLTVFYLSKKYIYQYCAGKIQTLYGTTNQSYYKLRLIPSLLIILQKSVNAIWLAVLSASIPAILNIKTPFATATIYVLTFLAVHKALKNLLIESFGHEKGDKKLLASLEYISPRHLYKSLNTILLFSLVSLLIITVLTVFAYRSDVVELLWFIYRLGMLILMLWLATQKTLIFKLLPSAESRLGKFIHRIIKIIYPVFITFVVLLFAIRGLGYTVLTYVLLKTCIKSFVISFIAFWVWKFLHNRLNYVREINLKRDHIKKGSPEETGFRTVTTVYNVSINYGVFIIAAVIIVSVWTGTFRDAVGSPAAPYLVQKIFGQIGAVLGAIGNGLQYRITFEDGKYTTPLKIILALGVLFASFFIARHIKTLLEDKVYHKLRLERGSRHTLSTLARYVIVGIAVLIGLNLAGIPLKSLTIFAGAFGIAIGFGMQNIISNFVSGIILLVERPIRVGDVVTFEDGTLGTVDKFKIRSTTINTPDGVTITVPNSKFIESRITNLTHPTPHVRGCIKVKVAYGSDTTLVKKCLLEIAKQNPNVRAHPEPIVRFAEFGANALVFELYFWADDPEKRWFIISELNFIIDEVFRKNNITLHP